MELIYNSIVYQPPPMGQMGGGMVLESDENIPAPDWHNDLVIFEHINIDSGGRRNRDPGKEFGARPT